jgi:DNA-binding NarL/FixJ family response regulator
VVLVRRFIVLLTVLEVNLMRRQLFYDPHTLRLLTPRESTVLSAAKNNQPLGDIANSLEIPQSLVIRHLSNIVGKINDSDKQLAHQLLFAYNLDLRG